MRRPAQHHLGPTAAHGWAHPYTGPLEPAVFDTDGGPGVTPPAPAPPPAPAEIVTAFPA